MSDPQGATWLRINGIGHAFSRELGCTCDRCRSINFAVDEPPDKLEEEFPGWYDPPWRAHTSASILIPGAEGSVKSHILIDAGAGVGDSLVCSRLEGLDNIRAILISHWHPDHVLSLNQICESVRRSSQRKSVDFVKIPAYCTLATYDRLREKQGFSFEFNKRLCFHEILPGVPFQVEENPRITFTGLEVAHGKTKGAVIYVADIGPKRVIFAWDIDIPDAQLTPNGKKNIDVIRDNLSVLKDAALLLIAVNTWKETGTGHTSFVLAHEYIAEMNPKKTLLVHLSGHEDGKGNPGYGWSDLHWEHKVSPYKVEVAKQGMLIKI